MLGGKRVSTPNISQCLAAEAGKEDHAIEIKFGKLNEMAKGNAIKKQGWLIKLKDTLVTNALETAKQNLNVLAAQLKICNSENEARTINKLFSTDASKV